MQYNALDMLTGVTGGVVRGSRVNLVQLICMCAAGIGLASVNPCRGCSVCRGSFIYNLYYFACINTVALLKAFLAWKIRWVVAEK